MKSSPDRITQALAATTRAGVLDALSPRRPALALPEINRLAAHLCELPDERRPLKIALLRTYTTELLASHWTLESLLQGFELTLYQAPYGALLQELQPGAGLLEFAPEVTYLFLRWEDLHPRLAGPVTGLPDRAAVQAEALEYLGHLLAAFREKLPGLLVLTLLPRMSPPELGIFDAMADDSEAAFFNELKRGIAKQLRDGLPSTYFQDLDEVVTALGRAQCFDARLWHTARCPFSVAGAQAVVARLMSYPVLLKCPQVKCLVLDADNTLWGGIIGEDGMEGIQLGPDYPGSTYLAFQRRLLALQGRGLLLALCSKNNAADVLEVLRHHPHQLLREEHFAAMRVNWEPKPGNLQAIAQELNIGIDALLFVDDSDFECEAVRRQCPGVRVVQAPGTPLDLPECLDGIPQLEVLQLTDEDRRRAELYAGRRKDQQLKATAASLDEYLASLEMVMHIGLDDRRHAPRIAQLTQKTNQFNLTTRRYTEADIIRFMDDPDWLVAHFRLADIFGDHGLVGVALIRLEGGTAEVDTLLMSCRVIGRGAESAFLAHLLAALAQRGIRRVRGYYYPTAKNEMVKDFWPRHGFAAVDEAAFELEPGAVPEARFIRVETESPGLAGVPRLP
ncbi:MAG: HAD-IIIC family phosphatase [Armatimonadota bacterium]